MFVIKLLLVIFAFFFGFVNFSFSQNSMPVKTGIDCLIDSHFEMLKGKNVGIVTNHAGRTRSGSSTVEAFLKQSVCKPVALYTPEHGFYTTVPAGVKTDDEYIYGLKAYSLYGKYRKPSREMLKNIDVVVVDIQDIGIRSYTYISSVYNVMDACAEYGIPVVVLDRPNPLGCEAVDGNVPEHGRQSFVSIVPVPYIHGMTIGELATYINSEGLLSGDYSGNPRKCALTVVKMRNYKRSMIWEDTKFDWFPTSPHIPTPEAARGAAVLGAFGELGIFSIGIGTSMPFQYFGSPVFDFDLFESIAGIEIDGVKLIRSRYQPFYGMHSGKPCYGYLLKFSTDKDFKPYTAGMKIFLALRKIKPEIFSSIKAESEKMFKKVTGNDIIFEALLEGNDYKALAAARKGLEEFKAIREKYLIYE